MKIRALICSFVLLFTLFSGYSIYGQTVEKSRTIKKTFKVEPGTEIEITNKYGNIHLIPWEKDSVQFNIELLVKGTKDSKVDKSYDFIEFDFKTTEYYIIAQTLFAGKSSFWSDVSDLTGTIFNSSTKTKIDYTVYLPANARLKIMNKYGNIYIADHAGAIDIDLSNGDLKAHNLSGNTSIKTEFGNTNIWQIDEGNLNISYGEVEIAEAENLTIESKSTRFDIDQVNNLSLNSRRDKFYLKEAGYVNGTINFTTIEMDQLSQKINLSAKYGNVEVKSFSDKVSSFYIDAENADIILHFTDNKQYKIEATVDVKTEVLYSADIKNITSKEMDGDEELIEVKSTIGGLAGKIVPITMKSRGGSISLKLK
jgi:hypothetical protein